MHDEILSRLAGARLEKWNKLILDAGLDAGTQPERVALIFEGDELIGTGGRDGNVLKQIAIAEDRQGEDLSARIISLLRTDAFADGHSHLFLYTKPRNEYTFRQLFFYPVIKTSDVLLMEDKRGGIEEHLASYPEAASGEVGAIVMNANPFTKGHRYLVERAAEECDRVFVLVLSEDLSEISAQDRLNMVRIGCEDLENVSVLPSGPYLISRATFPTYFLKERDREDAWCELDVAIFLKYYAPRLGITVRYVGTESRSELTAKYNGILERRLPDGGVRFKELARKECCGEPISASSVRELIHKGDTESIGALLPTTTINYLKTKGLL